MTTSVKVHVNGRYRATVKHTDAGGNIVSTTVVEGNYEGSPNPHGEETFHLQHPAKGTFEVTEEYIGDAPKADPVVEKQVPQAAGANDTPPGASDADDKPPAIAGAI